MPQCLKCRYDLRGNSSDGRCPECGYRVALSLGGVRPHERVRDVAERLSVAFLLVFTAYSFGTASRAWAGEPFYRHADWGHFLGYVILPTAALVLCAGWAAAVVWLVSRGVLRWWWILPLAWSALASLVLVMGMQLYLSDIIEMGSWGAVPSS